MKKNQTRRALFMSALSLLLCVSMLVGTTFAWFTDSVESDRNVIAAGNLDVELYHSDKNAKEAKVDSSTKLFDDVDPKLWEPGAVAYENLQVKNVGTLALKYQLSLTVLDETVVNGYKLSDVIMVGTKAGGFTASSREGIVGEVTSWTKLSEFKLDNSTKTLAAGAAAEVIGIVLYWQPNANEIDNRYNLNNGQTGTLQLSIGVNLFATQVEAESDSFGENYDEEAWDNALLVTTADDLKDAIAAGNEQIMLANDINLTEALEIPAGTTLSLNLNGKTLENEEGYAFESKGNLTISGEGTIAGKGGIRATAGTLTINGGNYYGDSDWNNGTYQHAIKAENANVVINGGNFDATVNGQTNAMLNASENATITINGGTFKNVEGELPQFAPYIATYEKNGKIVINDGTFYGGWRFNGETATTDIYGGNFTVGFDGQSFHATSTHVVTVSGGTFVSAANAKLTDKVKARDIVAPGYKAVETSSGYMVISEDNDYVADGVLKSADEKTFYLSSKEGFKWMESQTDSYFAGKTVTLEESIDFGGETIGAVRFWQPENKTTFDGNGMTISNFVLEDTEGNAGLFNGTMTVKNLNIVGAEVTGKYVGVIAGNMYGDIINCTVKDSVINGTYWQTGALVGQYNSGNIIDCVVENCEINGLAAVGGLVGILNESTGERKIENCTVKDCEINQTGSFGGDYDKMFGVVTGCVNIENSTVTISGVYENNTVKGVASDVLCGDVADSTKVYVLTTADNGMKLKEDVATGAKSLSSVADLTEEAVTIPAEVSALGNAVFAGNANITSVTIPATVTEFGASGVSETNASGGAFKGSNVETVTLSEGMTEIPAAAFNGATKLTSVNIPASVEKIGVNAFRSTAITELTIPATVKEIAYGAFRDMDSLTTVTIEGDNVTLPGYVFRDCTNLHTVYLNMESLTLNGNMNFANASSNNPNTNNITFHCKNAAVAEAVKTHMGVGSYVAIYVNGTLYAEIK